MVVSALWEKVKGLVTNGELIKQARKKKGLSQAKLARLLGIKQAVLSNWELNYTAPSSEETKRVFDLLNSLNDEEIRLLWKRGKNIHIKNNNSWSSLPKTNIRKRTPMTEEERRGRLPFLFLEVEKILCNGRTAISLFSGIGGFSLGFRFAGFKILGYVEIYEPFRRIYELNFPNTKCLGTDIQRITDNMVLEWKQEYGEIDCLFGGPPCQGFSLAGKRDRLDARNQLFRHFARTASLLKPKTVLMENVSLMSSMKDADGIPMLKAVNQEFEKAGYITCFKRIKAEEYGVPQCRRRMFMLGIRKDLNKGEPSFPKPTHGHARQLTLLGDKSEPYVTFWEATGDLESLKAGEQSARDKWHVASRHPKYVVEMLEGVPEGKSAHDNPNPGLRPISGYNTTYKRNIWDEPCSTISTNFTMVSGCRNVHPSDTRALTYREAMRVQTFPDNYILVGKKGDIRKGIGNAVPPLLAMKIATHIHNSCLS